MSDREPTVQERRECAANATRLQAIIKKSKTDWWAHEMFAQWESGKLAPQAGDNELRFRALVRTIRELERIGGRDRQVAQLRAFLRNAWRHTSAAAAIARGERETLTELRELWGDAALPPADAIYTQMPADELMIRAVVARIGR